MKAIDLQTQMTTEKGALFPIALKESFEVTFKTEIPYYQTEDEMMQVFRDAGIKAIFMVPTPMDFDQMAEIGEYMVKLKEDYPDVVYGSWAPHNPNLDAKEHLVALEKYIDNVGSFGIFYYGASTGIPANDKSNFPLYELFMSKNVPVKISVGHTALGAGMPGGMGIRLGTERPIPNIDDVAAQFPNLKIIASHCPWPFHSEMISVMVHKANVYNEVHGWSPKYFPAELKKEMNGRLKRKFMYGSDYPFFAFKRLFDDWEAEGFKPESLENIYYKNAQNVFGIE